MDDPSRKIHEKHSVIFSHAFRLVVFERFGKTQILESFDPDAVNSESVGLLLKSTS